MQRFSLTINAKIKCRLCDRLCVTKTRDLKVAAPTRLHVRLHVSHTFAYAFEPVVLDETFFNINLPNTLGMTTSRPPHTPDLAGRPT